MSRPLPYGSLWPPLDLPDQQSDGAVDVIGLDVADDGVEQGADLVVVCRCQCPPLLPCIIKQKGFRFTLRR